MSTVDNNSLQVDLEPIAKLGVFQQADAVLDSVLARSRRNAVSGEQQPDPVALGSQVADLGPEIFQSALDILGSTPSAPG